MEGEDLELFERSIRGAVARDDIDAALEEVGWTEALSLEPRAAVSVLFSRQGEAGRTSSALDHVLRSALGLDAPVVLPAPGSATPPGRLHGDRLAVHGLLLGSADVAVVVAGDVAVRVPMTELSRRSVEGVDPWLGLVEVTGEVAAAEVQPMPGWAAAVALGQVAVGHELVGASRKMLALARQHALEREQFGQPVAAFQAIRHRLAETLVAIETADAVLDAAWLDRSPQTAAMAKALAGRGARTTARHCQQVLAGVGFTTEHDLHRYVRRTLVLDQLLGSARALTRQLGDDLLATRKLPPLLPL
ncbi:MAG: acyl-CoA dehydrogenase domain protein [Actinomycetia bacterium]|nr:acyl-CoA dehydrogenase domain protein [Actinomycetes bacterium]